MGYSLAIGQGTLDTIPDDEYGDGYLDIVVEDVRRDDAPAFGEPTDYTNARWPSYSSWSNFADFVGLTHVLFDQESNSIRGGHPGHHLITPKFKADVDHAMEQYMKRFPDATPTFENFESHPENGDLCRLVWLQYWTDWALENCTNPIFKNT